MYGDTSVPCCQMRAWRSFLEERFTAEAAESRRTALSIPIVFSPWTSPPPIPSFSFRLELSATAPLLSAGFPTMLVFSFVPVFSCFRLTAPIAVLPTGEAVGFSGYFPDPLWIYKIGTSAWKVNFISFQPFANSAGYRPLHASFFSLRVALLLGTGSGPLAPSPKPVWGWSLCSGAVRV